MVRLLAEIEGWSDFYVAMAGAAAALAGLLFVALSINVKEIVSIPLVAPRAVATISLLVGPLLVAGIGLMPDVSHVVRGLAMLVVTVLMWLVPSRYQWRIRHVASSSPAPWWIGFTFSQVTTIPGIVGALLFSAGVDGGLYLVAITVLLAFVYAMVNAWVLLVEILR